jgi:hypothetical protein
MARRRVLQPLLCSVSLTCFIVLASLIIPLRQTIRWPSVRNGNSGVRPFGSKMTLPTLRLGDGNRIPAVSIAQLS